MPPPPVAALTGALNPIEALVMSLNTNTYLIGLSMILLNLGGRHLAMGLTPEQDRFFQVPWMRRGMLFVVIFVATRNLFTALWLSIGLVLFIGYLLNEHSSLYLFGEPVPQPPAPPPVPAISGLTGEEQEIYKRLHDKVQRTKSTEELKQKEGEAKEPLAKQLEGWYRQNMAAMRSLIAA
jgi:hypothetical protein